MDFHQLQVCGEGVFISMNRPTMTTKLLLKNKRLDSVLGKETMEQKKWS